jgi:hypothetical protein
MGSVRNRREVDAALRALTRRGHKAARKAGHDIAEDAQLVARALLTHKSHPPATKTPAPPMTPPAMVSGRLAGQVRVVGPTGSAEGYVVHKVGPTGVVYARIQELGGVTGAGYRTKLPPRPYMLPSWRQVKPWVPRIVRHAWESS